MGLATTNGFIPNITYPRAESVVGVVRAALLTDSFFLSISRHSRTKNIFLRAMKTKMYKKRNKKTTIFISSTRL
jgi:hypothetical protein